MCKRYGAYDYLGKHEVCTSRETSCWDNEQRLLLSQAELSQAELSQAELSQAETVESRRGQQTTNHTMLKVVSLVALVIHSRRCGFSNSERVRP